MAARSWSICFTSSFCCTFRYVRRFQQVSSVPLTSSPITLATKQLLPPPAPKQVSVCPFDLITGYTLFVDDEERAPDMVTRADMEGQLVVNLAGRCAEKLVMGESEVTSERQWAGRAYGDRCKGAAGWVWSYKQRATPPARLCARAPPLAR